MPPHNHHDAGANSPIHYLRPRYTCPLFYADCGGGYCCPPAQSCQNGGSDTDSIPTCHLGPPGLLGSDSPAQLAPGVSSSSSSSSSSSVSSSSSTSSTPPSTSMTWSSPTNTSTPAAASASATAAPMTNGTISGSGISGIVVGVVVLLALAGGSVWSLVRRRRREREREASLLPAGGSGGGNPGSDCLAGFFGAGRKEGEAEAGSPEMRQQLQQQQPSPRRSLGGIFQKSEDVARRPGRPSFGPEWEDGLVYMYGGSNVGKTPGEVPGRVEALGDVPVPVQRPPPAIPRKKVGSQRKAPVYEMEGSPAGSASP